MEAQWGPLLHNKGGLIQVNIGGHPPIPPIPPRGFICFLDYSNIYYFSSFSGPKLLELF